LQVSHEDGERLAREIGAASYYECSAKAVHGVRDVFETAVRLTLYDNNGQLKKASKSDLSCKSKTKRAHPSCVLH